MTTALMFICNLYTWNKGKQNTNGVKNTQLNTVKKCSEKWIRTINSFGDFDKCSLHHFIIATTLTSIASAIRSVH